MQAVDFGPACPQPAKYTGATLGIRDVDEDCLYLNVFTPDIVSIRFVNVFIYDNIYSTVIGIYL